MSRNGAARGMNPKLLFVMRRDQWQCQMPLCLHPPSAGGRVISKRLAGSNDPWAPSADHIVPKSLGGQAIPGNLRAAHRHCNKVRGDKLRGDEYSFGVFRDHIDVLGGKIVA